MSGKDRLPPKRRQRRYVDDAEYASASVRIIRRLGHRTATADLDAAEYLLAIQAELDEAWRRTVAGWRAAGYSDREIGDRLGITRQGVQWNWPRKGSA